MAITLTDGADTVTLWPEWSAREVEGAEAAGHRTAGGKAVRHVWATWRGWELPLRHVAAADAALLNDWWFAGTALELSFEGDGPHDVRLVGDTPLRAMPQPYQDEWDGVLHVQAIEPE